MSSESRTVYKIHTRQMLIIDSTYQAVIFVGGVDQLKRQESLIEP